MLCVRKYIIIGIILFILPSHISSQNKLLIREDLLAAANQVLSLTYNNEFNKAKELLVKIKKEIPDHPATPFLGALIIYWEFYPLTPENTNSESFIRLMEETSSKAHSMVEKDEDDLEGIFFSLFSRAFYIMYWSDNGRPSKAFPFLNYLYKQTMKGIERKEEFVEFYFSSGLYKYYIEAYPEKYPIYKRIKFLFRQGNKKEGLEELAFCAENAVYLRVEARFFLSMIYLGYENNTLKAYEYAELLYNEFPNNPSYIENYAKTLLYKKDYAKAEIIINRLFEKNNTYCKLQAHILNGYLLEKYKKNLTEAYNEYQKGEDLTGSYGQFATNYKALAWMGIGRYHKHKGNLSLAAKYFKMAKNISPYGYIVDDK